MTLTKSDIINGIYNSTDLKLHQATKTVENLFELIKKTLGSVKGDEKNRGSRLHS